MGEDCDQQVLVAVGALSTVLIGFLLVIIAALLLLLKRQRNKGDSDSYKLD
jgi:uncharacterized membrane protein